MMKFPCARQAMVAIAGIGAATALALPGGTAPIVRGDTAAWAEIVAAYRKLNSLSGFRVKSAVSGEPGGKSLTYQGPVVYEIVPLNGAYTVHEIHKTTQGTVEVFYVGDRVVQRQPGGRCVTLPPKRIPLLTGPFGSSLYNFVYTISRKPESAVDETWAHAYGLTVDSGRGDEPTVATIYIGVQTGFPRRIVSTIVDQGTKEKITGTQDFYDYGANINIELPNC